MLFAEADFKEEPEDARVRAVWLKENKARLAKVCRSIVSIESDEAKRAKLLRHLEGLEKAFGIPRLVASSEAEGRVAGSLRVVGCSRAEEWRLAARQGTFANRM